MMRLIFLVSIAACVLALARPEYIDLLLIGGPCALASLYILLRDAVADHQRGTLKWPQAQTGSEQAKGPKRFTAAASEKRPYVIVDGSNVLHWNAGEPALGTVRAVVDDLTRRGFMPGVMFDANAGYKIGDRYQDDAELAHRLGLPDEQVLVVPKGTPADHVILQAARRLKARVVTNDRFRDWAEEFPEVATPQFLIRGSARDGKVWLDLAG